MYTYTNWMHCIFELSRRVSRRLREGETAKGTIRTCPGEPLCTGRASELQSAPRPSIQNGLCTFR